MNLQMPHATKNWEKKGEENKKIAKDLLYIDGH